MLLIIVFNLERHAVKRAAGRPPVANEYIVVLRSEV
jgi:hypothetical protein